MEQYMIDNMLHTLNVYVRLFAAGDEKVLPAIGRIINTLECETGKKVIAAKGGYVLI